MICPIILSSADVSLLIAFVAGAEEKNDVLAMLSEIDSVTRSEIVLQLEDAIADRLTISEKPGLDPRNSGIDSRLRHPILQSIQPLLEGKSSGFRAVVLNVTRSWLHGFGERNPYLLIL